jgi:hypothetical protein
MAEALATEYGATQSVQRRPAVTLDCGRLRWIALNYAKNFQNPFRDYHEEHEAHEGEKTRRRPFQTFMPFMVELQTGRPAVTPRNRRGCDGPRLHWIGVNCGGLRSITPKISKYPFRNYHEEHEAHEGEKTRRRPFQTFMLFMSFMV